MDTAILGISIIALFSVAHERLLELVRWMAERLVRGVWLKAVIRGATAGPATGFVGIGLALCTNANLFDAFRHDAASGSALFFARYLNGFPEGTQAILGCVVIGLSVTLGAVFWHDLVKGLMDLRATLQQVRGTPEQLLAGAALPLPVPVQQSEDGLR